MMPTTLDEALADRVAHPGALLLAGGTDVMVEINEGHRRLDTEAPTVIALGRVPELSTWTHDPVAGTLTIGAGITWAEIEATPLAELVPALAQAARTVGSPQIRHAGTIGGNLATCSPAGDGLPVLVALDAVVHLAGGAGRRSLPIAGFMLGVKHTALLPDELIESITVPLLDGWQGYSKVGVRNAMVIATASACLATDRATRSIRLALGSVAPTVVRCPEAERFATDYVDWAGGGVPPDVAARFAELARAASRPIDDHRSSAEYRRHAVGVMASRLLVRAFLGGAT
jgi:CO/xanthine dehydrogenase FAD-binding subunit